MICPSAAAGFAYHHGMAKPSLFGDHKEIAIYPDRIEIDDYDHE